MAESFCGIPSPPVIPTPLGNVGLRLILLVVIAGLSGRIGVASPLPSFCAASGECQAEKCTPLINCTLNDTVKDVCNCCHVCQRQLGDPCSWLGTAEHLGICGSGLICFTPPLASGIVMSSKEEGVCINATNNCTDVGTRKFSGCNMVEGVGCLCLNVTGCSDIVAFQYGDLDGCMKEWNQLEVALTEPCLRAKCNLVFQPECPDDSELIPTEKTPGDCCQQPGVCRCAKQKCFSQMKPCELGFEAVLMEAATGSPGKCCDRWDCLPTRPKDCSLVHCPVDFGVCPTDSYKPPVTPVKGECCPLESKCQCIPDICEPLICGEGKRPKLIQSGSGSPGNCCDRFVCVEEEEVGEYCVRDGLIHRNGDVWHQDKCTECRCVHLVVLCKNLRCPPPPLDCSRMSHVEGECCGVCAGCASDAGDFYNHTDVWHPDDCTLCRCDSGKTLCQSQMCSVNCHNPRKIPGQCCPVCDGPALVTLPPSCPSLEFCTLRCPLGLRRTNDYGCYTCECETWNEEIFSSSTDTTLVMTEKPKAGCHSLENCSKRCAHGYETDGRNCPICTCRQCPPLHVCYKQCLSGFQINQYGCPICQCKGTTSSDISTSRQDLSCRSLEGVRDSGEWWFDGCRHCYCYRGTEFCSLVSCPEAICESPQYVVGLCCPTCSDKNSTGLSAPKTVCHAPGSGYHYAEGETWDLDSCTKCTCHVGHVLCQVQKCPPIPCINPKRLVGQCCPVCESSSLIGDQTSLRSEAHDSFCITDEGVAHQDGAAWRTGPCTSCVCQVGKVQCYTETCLQLDCQAKHLHMKGQCCPICIEFSRGQLCHYQGLTFIPGEAWRADNCTNCTCNADGGTVCTKEICPACKNAVEVAGQCCAQCLDDHDKAPLPSDKPVESDGRRLDETQQLQIILIFLCLFLIVAVLIAIVFVWWSYRRRKSYSLSSRGTASTPDGSQSNNLDCEQNKSLLSTPESVPAHLTKTIATDTLSSVDLGFFPEEQEKLESV